jgi:hypothetical protein
VLVVEEDKETKKSLASAAKRVAEQKTDPADELSPDELKLLKELEARDSEVKAHEAAHQAAGGGMTGAATYTYQQGPDGKMYAIGGEVSISISSGSSPEETIKNARQVAAAAMAASDPSPQDHAVASSARVMEMKALQQLAKESQKEMSAKDAYQNEGNTNSNPSQAENLENFDTIDISA